MNKVKSIAVAGIAAVSLSAVGLVACSSGGGSSSASAPCVVQLSGNGSSIYMEFSSSSGPVSPAECQQIENDGGQVAGVSSAVVSSLPSGLSSTCSGSEDGYSYSVYNDGSTPSQVYASAACTDIQDGS